MDNANEAVRGLQEEISQTNATAEHQATMDDVNAHIDRYTEDPAAQHQSLRERLEAAMTELGADHPSLVEKMQVVLSDLSNAGV